MANVDEESFINGENEYTKKVSEYAEAENSGVVVMCAKLESELSEMNIDDKKFRVSLSHRETIENAWSGNYNGKKIITKI